MVNDTTTLQGSLDEMKDQLISELDDKGVTATFDSTTGLLGLISEIGDIQQSSGATNIVQGTFTTGSTGASTGTVTLNYTGNGYPIYAIVEVSGGAYNNGTGGNTTWYNSTSRYDVGLVTINKARATTTPTYETSGADNYGIITYLYKSSSSSSTTYSRGGTMTANTYTSSSTNPASGNNCVRFKGNGKTLAYYVGNRTTSTYGLARSTTFSYTVIYSE